MVKRQIFILFLFFSFFLFSDDSEWVLAISEFNFETSNPMYSSYSKIIPEMFLSYLEGKANRCCPGFRQAANDEPHHN